MIPDPITLNLEWSKSQVVIYPEDKELALIKEPIRINGQDVQQNEIKIDYDVFLEPLSFNLDDFLLKVKIEAIKLALRNTKKYKELYDPITVEEMKKLGLVDIIE